jgi:hypothetical protein
MPTRTAATILDVLWETTESLVVGGVTRSHDLTGVVFQRLIADRKFLATYYTMPSGAALLAGLAIPLNRPLVGNDWNDQTALAAARIGDFACGTGTLLSTAYQRIGLLHEIYGGNPKALHPTMMQSGLVGLDVLTVAVHLTAAMLAGTHPDTPFEGECLLTMPYGSHGWGLSVGSLELLNEQSAFNVIQAAAETAGGRGAEEVRNLVFRVAHENFDLVIMNPPFTRHGAHEGDRTQVHNPAFAAFGADEEEQNRLAGRRRQLRKEGSKSRVTVRLSSFGKLAEVRIKDITLAQTAHQMASGRLWVEGMSSATPVSIPICAIGNAIERIGPHDLDITGSQVKQDGLPQGPFEKIDGVPAGSAYPCLWNHDNTRERRLVVQPDSHCRIRQVAGQVPPALQERAEARWETAARPHYNRDLQFNSKSLIVAMTPERAIGGRAWPSVVFANTDHEYAFALWMNSTLGLLCHWWMSNKSQTGRGTTTVTSIPAITTLDVRALSHAQHLQARRVFDLLSERRFLPFDQIHEDDARAELDRGLFVDVLGLDPVLCAAGGYMERLRRKLAVEPQIHSDKRTRVVFTPSGERNVRTPDSL